MYHSIGRGEDIGRKEGVQRLFSAERLRGMQITMR
jgi:hypothetical protein